MRLLKFLLTISIIIGGIYGIYHFGMNIISDKIAETVSTDLGDSENMDEVKQVVNEHPEIRDFIDEGANIDESNLPFTTKEAALKTVIQKIGLGELQKVQTQFENGMTQSEIEALITEVEGKLTTDEILALKAIAYKELNK